MALVRSLNVGATKFRKRIDLRAAIEPKNEQKMLFEERRGNTSASDLRLADDDKRGGPSGPT